MDSVSSHILNELTTEFYRRNAESFSTTRSRAWDGWNQCAGILRERGAWTSIARVADIGCGNLRFKAFLDDQLDECPEIWAVDNCTSLLPEAARVHFQELDIVKTLIEDGTLEGKLRVPPCDLVCAFGVMHHVPDAINRKALFESMLDITRPRGHVIASFWQFMNDDRIARKALETTKIAIDAYPDIALEQDDYLLGWQDRDDSFRYCHHFDAQQIDELADHVSALAEPVSRFEADGKSGNLNAYLILKKKEVR